MSNLEAQEPVVFETKGPIATIRLNRPERFNAMNDALMGGISSALAKVDADPDLRVVVLTGTGRGFCAGADLAAMADDTPVAESKAAESDQSAAQDFFNAALRDLHNCPVPTIARVNGAAAGGGFGLALACDITIAARSAFFVATFGPRLGIVPDMGATWNIPLRAGRARALGISLLGDRVSAQQALDWGLIWDVAEDDQLDAKVAEVADRLAKSSPAAALRIRHTIDAATHNSFSDQLDLEMVHQGVLIPRNMMEGAKAFVDKREPQFDGRRDKHSDLPN